MVVTGISCVASTVSDGNTVPQKDAELVEEDPSREVSHETTHGSAAGLSDGGLVAVRNRMSAIGKRVAAVDLLVTKQHVPHFRDVKVSKKLSVAEALEISGKKASRDRYVVNPEFHKIVNFWDLGTMLALIYVALVTPVEVALLTVEINVLFFINVFVDLIFLADMVLQFFIVYRERTPYGFRIENSHAKIIRNYLRTWFSVDLLSVLPYSYIALLVNSTAMQRAKVLKTVRLLRLIKLVRVVRASRVFHRWETSMAINYNSLRFCSAVTVLLVSSHWMACIWALLATETEPGQESWIDYSAPVTGEVPETAAAKYFTALYWSSVTVTSVGYGDVIPVTLFERVICTLLVFTSGLLWAYALGEIMTTLANIDMHAARFRQSLDDLNYMMRDQNIPSEMQRRLRGFFFQIKDVQRVRSYREILNQLSPSLQGDVALQVNARWVQKVWYFEKSFKALPNAFMAHLSNSLEVSVFAQSDVFYEPWILYILHRGVCVRSLRVKQSGSVWGEDFILTDETLLDKATVLALTFTQVAVVRRHRLMHAMSRFPEVNRVIRRAVVRVAVVRGIWNEVRRRKKEKDAGKPKPRVLQHFMDFAQLDYSHSLTDIKGQLLSQGPGAGYQLNNGERSCTIDPEELRARDEMVNTIVQEQVDLRRELSRARAEMREMQESNRAQLSSIQDQLCQVMRVLSMQQQQHGGRATSSNAAEPTSTQVESPSFIASGQPYEDASLPPQARVNSSPVVPPGADPPTLWQAPDASRGPRVDDDHGAGGFPLLRSSASLTSPPPLVPLHARASKAGVRNASLGPESSGMSLPGELLENSF